MKPVPRLKSSWRIALLAFGLASVWGCGPPMVTQALPPGIEPLPQEVAEKDRAEALGEQAELGVIQPSRISVQVITNAPPTEPGQTARTKSGVEYETVTPGDGEEAVSGKTAVVHYVVTLDNDTEVDSSRKTGEPYRFVIGGSGAIDGMQQGVAGMKVGEVRKLTVPPALAYGKAGSGKVPPDATLHFEVELLEVE